MILSPERTVRRHHFRLIAAGILSILLYLGMWALSLEFNWGEGHAQRPIVEYLLLYFCLFAVYAAAVYWTLKEPAEARALYLILVLGLLMRAAVLPAQPIQEDDVYRYLWDGKVAHHGINPYKYSPEQVTYFKQFMIREPERFARTYDADSVRELETLATLKWDNERALIYMERINHPDLPTIYPPLAQFVFRAVAAVAPDSILAMRLTFLAFDLLTVGFLILLLKTLGKNPAWCVVWFWSPLVVKETFNSTHLDIIGIACLTGSLVLLVRARHLAAHGLLALSVLAKLYPVILFPFYLKEQGASRARRAGPWAAGAAVFAGTIALGYLPFLDIGEKTFASLKTFSTYWQSNDSLFALLVWFYREALGIESAGAVGFSYDLPFLLAKITVLCVLGAVWLVLLAGSRPQSQTTEHPALPVLRRLFILMALIFLLSPVQNPWYLLWVLPFVCVFPMRSWILLTGLMGLYYLDFYWEYQQLDAYKAWTPWLEYLPFYLLLGWEWWGGRRFKADA